MKYRLCVLMLLAGLSLSGSPAQAKLWHLPEQAWQASYKLELRNSGSSLIKGSMALPLPNDYPQLQRCVFRSLPPGGVIRTDAQGNKVLFMAAVALKPGQTRIFRLEYNVYKQHLLADIDLNHLDPGSEASMAAYLQSTALYPLQHPVVQRLKARLVSSQDTSYFKALKLYDWVRSQRFALGRPPKTVPQALNIKEFQCLDAAKVYITLCRASGIPARLICGYVLRSDQAILSQSHSWTEIYQPPYGWLPVDPTLGRFDSGARLVCFAEERPEYIRLWQDQPAGLSFTFTPQLKPGDYRVTFSARELQLKPVKPSRIFARNWTGGIVQPESPDALKLKIDQAIGRKAYSTAARLLTSALTAQYDNLSYHRLWIKLNSLQGKLAEVTLQYRERSRQQPRDYVSRYASGLCALYAGDYGAAIEALEAALRLNPGSYQIYHNLGFALLNAKAYSQALDRYEQTLHLNAGSYLSYQNLINFYLLQDDLLSLRAIITMASQYCPQYKEALEQFFREEQSQRQD